MSDHGLHTMLRTIHLLYQYGVYSREEFEQLKEPENYSDLRRILDQAIDLIGAYLRREKGKS